MAMLLLLDARTNLLVDRGVARNRYLSDAVSAPPGAHTAAPSLAPTQIRFAAIELASELFCSS
jgi:hypothetical protein